MTDVIDDVEFRNAADKAWDKRGRGTAEEFGKLPPSKRDSAPKEWFATARERAAARKVADAKARAVPKPSQERIDANRKSIASSKRHGGELRGNAASRRARAEKLLIEFGGAKKGYCPCTHCGVKVSPGGRGGHARMEQDKILVAEEGGGYRMENLVPSCAGCNKHRGDQPFRTRPTWETLATMRFATDLQIGGWARGFPLGWDDPGYDVGEDGPGPVEGWLASRDVNMAFVDVSYEQWMIGGEVVDPDTIVMLGETAPEGFTSADSRKAWDTRGRRIPPPPSRPPGRPTGPTAGTQRPPGVLVDVPFADVQIAYRPRHPDGHADPGEIVWARIPFEEDPTQSKDRPVLVIGRTKDGKNLVAVQLTSKDKPGSLPIGAGTWDAAGRDSHIKLDRFVQIDASNYRREGAYVKKPQFQSIVDELTKRQKAPKVTLAAEMEAFDSEASRKAWLKRDHGNGDVQNHVLSDAAWQAWQDEHSKTEPTAATPTSVTQSPGREIRRYGTTAQTAGSYAVATQAFTQTSDRGEAEAAVERLRSQLSPDQVDACSRRSGTRRKNINASVTGRPGKFEERSAARAAQLDQVMRDHATPVEHDVLMRGTHASGSQSLNAGVGDEFTDPKFGSWTSHGDVARQFAHTNGTDPYESEDHHGTFIVLTNARSTRGIPGNGFEHETILPRGQRFRVTSITDFVDPNTDPDGPTVNPPGTTVDYNGKQLDVSGRPKGFRFRIMEVEAVDSPDLVASAGWETFDSAASKKAWEKRRAAAAPPAPPAGPKKLNEPVLGHHVTRFDQNTAADGTYIPTKLLARRAAKDRIAELKSPVHEDDESLSYRAFVDRETAFRHNLSPDEVAAHVDYINSGHRAINQIAVMQSIAPDPGAYQDPRIDMLDESMRSFASAPPTAELFRGTYSAKSGTLTANVGDEFTDPKFGSWSSNVLTATGFAKDLDERQSVTLVLHNAQQIRGIPGEPSEYETITPRNQRYRVLGIEDFDGYNADGERTTHHRILHVEAVDSPNLIASAGWETFDSNASKKAWLKRKRKGAKDAGEEFNPIGDDGQALGTPAELLQAGAVPVGSTIILGQQHATVTGYSGHGTYHKVNYVGVSPSDVAGVEGSLFTNGTVVSEKVMIVTPSGHTIGQNGFTAPPAAAITATLPTGSPSLAAPAAPKPGEKPANWSSMGPGQKAAWTKKQKAAAAAEAAAAPKIEPPTIAPIAPTSSTPHLNPNGKVEPGVTIEYQDVSGKLVQSKVVTATPQSVYVDAGGVTATYVPVGSVKGTVPDPNGKITTGAVIQYQTKSGKTVTGIVKSEPMGNQAVPVLGPNGSTHYAPKAGIHGVVKPAATVAAPSVSAPSVKVTTTSGPVSKPANWNTMSPGKKAAWTKANNAKNGISPGSKKPSAAGFMGESGPKKKAIKPVVGHVVKDYSPQGSQSTWQAQKDAAWAYTERSKQLRTNAWSKDQQQHRIAVFRGGLTSEQRTAQAKYIGASHSWMNQHAINGQIDGEVATLDSVFLGHWSTPPTAELLRGTHHAQSKTLKLDVGDEFTDPKFGSWSSSNLKAREFAGQGGGSISSENSVLLVLHNAQDIRGIPGTDYEYETITARNQSYRVVGIEDFNHPNGRYRILHVEAIDSPNLVASAWAEFDSAASKKAWESRRRAAASAPSDGPAKLLAAKVAAATADGSIVEHDPDIDQVRSELDDMADLAGPDWADDVGVKFTRFATQEPVVIVARVEGIGVSGAIGFDVYDDRLHVEYLGTTGIADGVGSQLTREVIRVAARDGLAIDLDPTQAAQPFWKAVGMTPDPLGTGSPFDGMSAERVAELDRILP